MFLNLLSSCPLTPQSILGINPLNSCCTPCPIYKNFTFSLRAHGCYIALVEKQCSEQPYFDMKSAFCIHTTSTQIIKRHTFKGQILLTNDFTFFFSGYLKVRLASFKMQKNTLTTSSIFVSAFICAMMLD